MKQNLQVFYPVSPKHAIFNGMKYTRDESTGYYLCTKTIDGIRKRLHVAVWEYHNKQEVPDGYHIHHINKNKDNNDISNLVCLKKEEHRAHHVSTLTKEDRQRMRENLINNVMPKAKAWHSTPEGLAWHRQNAIDTWENKETRIYICTCCGKTFETTNDYGVGANKFCSNNCKSAYRRKMGYDNIKKTCAYCGEEFEINKYSKQQCCSRICSSTLRKNKSNQKAG